MSKTDMVVFSALSLVMAMPAVAGESVAPDAAAAPAAATAGAAPQGGRRGAGGERRWERFLSRFDTDKDGKISKSEFRSGENPAMVRDKNGDGNITRDEVAGEARGGEAAAADRMFEQIDADKDGKITPAEIATERAAQFDRMDGNGDGQITREEMQNARMNGRQSPGVRGGQRGSDAVAPGAVAAPPAGQQP